MARPTRSVPQLTSDQVKHLEFIQAVVARLGNNSFLIKGWAMTLAGAFFAFAATRLSWKIASTGLVPILGFWALDAYYLRQERLFRKLYDAARRPGESIEPFSMNVGPYLSAVKWKTAAFSNTLIFFYGILAFVDVSFVVAGLIKARYF